MTLAIQILASFGAGILITFGVCLFRRNMVERSFALMSLCTFLMFMLFFNEIIIVEVK